MPSRVPAIASAGITLIECSRAPPLYFECNVWNAVEWKSECNELRSAQRGQTAAARGSGRAGSGSLRPAERTGEEDLEDDEEPDG